MPTEARELPALDVSEQEANLGREVAMRTNYYYSRVENLASEKACRERQLLSALSERDEARAEVAALKAREAQARTLLGDADIAFAYSGATLSAWLESTRKWLADSGKQEGDDGR